MTDELVYPETTVDDYDNRLNSTQVVEMVNILYMLIPTTTLSLCEMFIQETCVNSLRKGQILIHYSLANATHVFAPMTRSVELYLCYINRIRFPSELMNI